MHLLIKHVNKIDAFLTAFLVNLQAALVQVFEVIRALKRHRLPNKDSVEIIMHIEKFKVGFVFIIKSLIHVVDVSVALNSQLLGLFCFCSMLFYFLCSF